MTKLIRHLKKVSALYAVGTVWIAGLALPPYLNFKHPFKEIGEGFSVREMNGNRQFCIGTQSGLARIAVDKGKDGTLDEVLQNYPISAFMGGPGYRLGIDKIKENDQTKFERANYLFNEQEEQ